VVAVEIMVIAVVMINALLKLKFKIILGKACISKKQTYLLSIKLLD